MSEAAQLSRRQRPRVLHILLVEDNPGDVLIFKEAVKENHLAHVVEVAVDGQEAIDKLLLHKNDPEERPDVVILDLNLPRVSGLQVLERLKADPILRVIPTIILSSSQAASDIKSAYNLHANSYVRKAMNFDESLQILKTIEAFWFNTAILPQNE